MSYISRLGQTRSEARAVLGEPDSFTTRTQQNEYDSATTDTLVTLYYPGLTLGLFLRPHGNPGFSTFLEVTAARSDIPFALGVGAPCSRVLATLGSPAEHDSVDHHASLKYVDPESGLDEVLFECDSGAVRRIRWHPWID